MFEPYKALYIHIPFCRQRCGYCDFATQSVAPDSPLLDEYKDRLLAEIRAACRRGFLTELKTIYLGGGTPSFFGQARLDELMYMLSLSMYLTPEIECTMEANPDSLTLHMIKDLFALGVNRLSIGVQSFDDDVLKILGRVHNAKAAKNAIDIAHDRYENVSVDLMCGIPGQSRESFKASVQQAIDLGVTHVSVYPLTIERGTPFDLLVKSKEMADVDSDEQARQMEDAEKILRSAGFARYEVASYAKAGFECRHNIAYWTGLPYLGIGHSAVTMTQNDERRMRKQDDEIIDDLDAKQMRVEDIMLGLRMSKGVSDEKVAWASKLAPTLGNTLQRLEEKELVVHIDGRWRPTELGWLCGNDLYEPIYELAP